MVFASLIFMIDLIMSLISRPHYKYKKKKKKTLFFMLQKYLRITHKHHPQRNDHPYLGPYQSYHSGMPVRPWPF